MIARVWTGWTEQADADAYVDYVQQTGIESLRATSGNRGAWILRRERHGRAEFVVLSLWDSLDSVKGFAGEAVERAVFYPEDERFLVEREETVSHYEVFEAPSGVAELRIALTVGDYEEALSFYRDGLGLVVEESWDRPDGRGAILGAGRATLEVLSAEMAETVDRIEVGRRAAGDVRLALEVEDSAVAAEALVERGAELVGGPVKTPWGDTNVRVATPDGMQLTLFARETG